MPDGSPPPGPQNPDERAIEREVQRAGLLRDPMRHPLAAFLRGIVEQRRAGNQIAAEIRAASDRLREPLPPEALSEAVDAGARILARRFPWLVGGALSLALLCGFAAGAGSVWLAWRADRVAVAEGLSLALRDARVARDVLAANPAFAEIWERGRPGSHAGLPTRTVALWAGAPRPPPVAR